MLLDVVTRRLPAQAGAFGLGDWIAVGLVLALFLGAIIVPNVVARRAIGRKARPARTGVHGGATGATA